MPAPALSNTVGGWVVLCSYQFLRAFTARRVCVCVFGASHRGRTSWQQPTELVTTNSQRATKRASPRVGFTALELSSADQCEAAATLGVRQKERKKERRKEERKM